MNAANPAKSPRLKRVLQVLRDLPAASSWTIQQMAQVCAPGTCISELRSAGFLISCERRDGAFWYTLLGQEIKEVSA